MTRNKRRARDEAELRVGLAMGDEVMALAESRERGARGRARWLVGAGAGLATLAVAPVAGTLAWSRWGVDHDVGLPAAIDAERRNLQSPIAGRVAYYADDDGAERPLVLIHNPDLSYWKMLARKLHWAARPRGK